MDLWLANIAERPNLNEGFNLPSSNEKGSEHQTNDSDKVSVILLLTNSFFFFSCEKGNVHVTNKYIFKEVLYVFDFQFNMGNAAQYFY